MYGAALRRLFFEMDNRGYGLVVTGHRETGSAKPAPPLPTGGADLPASQASGQTRPARALNGAFGTRCFEQEKTERTEHHLPWSISPFPLWPPVRNVCLVAARRAVFFRGKSIAENEELLEIAL